MRVISGIWRGRRLKSPAGKDIRPTTDRVKEALFNIISPHLQDAWVIDLCCGSGGLGIEALSRGAARVIFVDSDRRSLACTKGNLELCAAPAQSWDLISAQAVPWLQRWQPPVRKTPWLLLADPPYRSDLTEGIVTALLTLSSNPGFRLAAIEEDAAARFPEAEGLATQVRRYGKSQLLFLTPETTDQDETEA